MGETGDKASADAGRRTHLGEIAEDASGFGISDLRLTRDLLVRPAQVMAAYDELGSTGGGRYPRPLRYYFILNGVLLLAYSGYLGAALKPRLEPLWLWDAKRVYRDNYPDLVRPEGTK